MVRTDHVYLHFKERVTQRGSISYIIFSQDIITHNTLLLSECDCQWHGCYLLYVATCDVPNPLHLKQKVDKYYSDTSTTDDIKKILIIKVSLVHW